MRQQRAQNLCAPCQGAGNDLADSAARAVVQFSQAQLVLDVALPATPDSIASTASTLPARLLRASSR
ncbi:hypothetical protein CVO74_18530 [Xanthomonas prunicola]|jgi:hypothetical protein|uniref:Uncharacterized protein n=1 Tax=Xanthomonas prunicola TaxID=2053930 RepID=A0A2N3RG15_9XANT|nr:hypothetical protein XpruCFBP8353_17875 [Xanthomonas prunicola]PKV15766.1 hypothetical protein XpruCFBP8354_17175 [Xanthomonas prunicola]PKV20079.1 hypothetical protein CVO74_18530 [Xanthomonas prunicola]